MKMSVEEEPFVDIHAFLPPPHGACALIMVCQLKRLHSIPLHGRVV